MALDPADKCSGCYYKLAIGPDDQVKGCPLAIHQDGCEWYETAGVAEKRIEKNKARQAARAEREKTILEADEEGRARIVRRRKKPSADDIHKQNGKTLAEWGMK